MYGARQSYCRITHELWRTDAQVRDDCADPEGYTYIRRLYGYSPES